MRRIAVARSDKMNPSNITPGAGIQAGDRIQNAVIDFDTIDQDGSPCLAVNINCEGTSLRIPLSPPRPKVGNLMVKFGYRPSSVWDCISEDEDIGDCIIWIVDRYGPMTDYQIWVALSRHLNLPLEFSMITGDLGLLWYGDILEFLKLMTEDESLELDEYGMYHLNPTTMIPDRWPSC